MEEPRIVINTTMTKEDCRKFFYVTTFKKNKYIVPLLALIDLILSFMVVLGQGYGGLNWIELIVYWVAFFVLTIVVLIIEIELKNSRRVKTDKTGTLGSSTTLKFYDDRLVMENETLRSKSELNYEQFYAVVESKEYFFFYFTANQASLIRKKDIKTDLNDFRSFIAEKFNGKLKKI